MIWVESKGYYFNFFILLYINKPIAVYRDQLQTVFITKGVGVLFIIARNTGKNVTKEMKKNNLIKKP